MSCFKSLFSCLGSSKNTVDDKVVSSTCMNVTESLSVEDKRMIQESYDVAFNQMGIEDKGVEFFIQFFQVFPRHKKRFKAFKGIPLEDLRSMPYTSNHGSKVINKISEIVNNIDKPDVLEAILLDMLTSHASRSIKPEEMMDILKLFVMFLKDTMGSKLTPQQQMAWTKLMMSVQFALEEVAETNSIRAAASTKQFHQSTQDLQTLDSSVDCETEFKEAVIDNWQFDR